MARRRAGWSALAEALPGSLAGTLAAAPFAPQLAVLVESPPDGDQWLHELKWDGYRLVATVTAGKSQLWSRNALPWAAKVPGIAKALEKLEVASAALDGELIAGSGRQEDFNLLQAVLSGASREPLVFVLFDLIHLDGVDLRHVPLRDRKGLLAQLLAKPIPSLAYSSHIEASATHAFEVAEQQGFEGLISKRAGGVYRHGRSDDWRKSKALASEEFAVVGYTPAKGARKGFGSLLLAKPEGKGWVYTGRVGTGFTDQLLRDLFKRIGRSGSPTPAVLVTDAKARDLRGATWFPPMFVVEVFTRGRGTSGLLRQPSLKAVRLDKDVSSLPDSDRAARNRNIPRQNTGPARAKRNASAVLETASRPNRKLARRG